jgi:hypothetical protein
MFLLNEMLYGAVAVGFVVQLLLRRFVRSQRSFG